MTLRTKTLTAVAALSIFATGFAIAQDAEPTVDEVTEAQAVTDEAAEGATAEDSAATSEGASGEEEATEDGESSTEEDAPEEPAAEEQPAGEEESADAEAPAEEASTEEGAAEETEAASDAPAEDSAAAEEEAPEEPAAEEQPAEEESADAEAPAEEASTEEGAAEETEAASDTPAEDGAAAEEEAPEEPAAEEQPAEEENADAEAPAEKASTEEDGDEHAAEGEHEESADSDHGGGHIEDVAFSFEGPFGKYDQFQLQRGLQVYTEVCAACHGLKFVPIRTLHDEGGPGLPEDQVRAYAANFTVVDKETGEERPGLPTDHFPDNTTAGAPDLSLMAKARAGFHGPYGTGLSQLFNGIGGPEYIHALLTGYTGEELEQAGTVLYGNSAFSTGATAMPPPLSDDLVTYEDGTPATVDQMSRDVSAFLMWTAEPKMMDRQQVGFVSVLFLIVLSVLLYLTNKRLWAPHKGKKLDS